MEKKEFYRNNLPHFQQPGQAYFVTWNLKDAVPALALKDYTQKLSLLKHQIEWLKTQKTEAQIIQKLIDEYHILRNKYLKAYDDLLDTQQNPIVDLAKNVNTEIIIQAIRFWEDKLLTNHAFSIMPNHVHWVFELFERDAKGNPVYLQDVLHSVKRFSSNRINKEEHRQGTLWHKESFDTTIRNEKHLYFAIKYTLDNPVKAGLSIDWQHWAGSWCGTELGPAIFNRRDISSG